MERMRSDFEEITKAHLLMKQKFTFITMLEKMTNYYIYGNWYERSLYP